jgi:PD-(D/E)XK nuclease superfamily
MSLWKSIDRQDARNARGLGEPASEVDAGASAVLKAAVEVHRVLGPSFFEGVYKQALCLELTLGASRSFGSHRWRSSTRIISWARCGPTCWWHSA